MSDRLEIIFQQIDLLAEQIDKIRYEEDMEEYELDIHMKPLCDIFNSYLSEFKMPEFRKIYYNSRTIYISPQDENSKTLVLFNGGKASLATALEAKRRGVNAVLFYVKNMDPTFARWAYSQEQAVKQMAEKLELPLVIQKTKMYYKNPLYRARILNTGLQYAIEHNFSIHIWTGTFDNVSIKNNPFRFFPNSVEFKDCYSNLVKSIYRDFAIITPLPTSSYMWDVLMSNRGFVKYIYSETTIDAVLTYLYSIDYSVVEEEDGTLYMKYMEKLRREYEVETGVKPKTIEDLWKRYFFYNIYKSKHHEELLKFLE